MKKIATTLLLAALIVTGCKSNEEKEATTDDTTVVDSTATEKTALQLQLRMHIKKKNLLLMKLFNLIFKSFLEVRKE